MYIIGFNGSMRTRFDQSYTELDHYAHNSAAVLLRDGEVVAAIEEERLDRLKHTHKAPLAALQFCLDQADISIDKVDHFAFYFSELMFQTAINEETLLAASRFLNPPLGPTPQTTLAKLIYQAFGYQVPESRLEFVPHHHCHAFSAFAQSGFKESLVVTLDGWGEREAGLIGVINAPGSFTPLATLQQSLGLFYLRVIAFLGYYHFDEYKVMGLAPYGDPTRFRATFARLLILKEGGAFEIGMVEKELHQILSPRFKGEPIGQVHMDLAASLQESVTTAVMHLLGYYRRKSGQRRLCLAGGVALNCAVNGKIVESGLFEDVFVQPAAYDAGCALGAALAVYYRHAGHSIVLPRCRSVYWGSPIGDRREILRELELWGNLLHVEEFDDISSRTAELLAGGNVVGWVQGRSEFGPRALGNRSILADPRPVENRILVNSAVKKREGYRPFAPSVTLEGMRTFFEVPESVVELPFMNILCRVKESFRDQLGAVTHIDGTARIQSVAKDVNPLYWNLLKSFEFYTGLPVLLNTSFNNNWEPIVDSVRDAVICYLTTALDYLVVGNFLIRREFAGCQGVENLYIRLPWYEAITTVLCHNTQCEPVHEYYLTTLHASRFARDKDLPLSSLVWRVLTFADNKKTLKNCLDHVGLKDLKERETLIEDLLMLWQHRRIHFLPPMTEAC